MGELLTSFRMRSGIYEVSCLYNITQAKTRIQLGFGFDGFLLEEKIGGVVGYPRARMNQEFARRRIPQRRISILLDPGIRPVDHASVVEAA